MARPPRSQQPRVNKPSPLKQVHLTRPLSYLPNLHPPRPEMGLVRDPMFWKRFSTAMHDAERGEVRSATRSSRSNSGSSGESTSRAKYGYVECFIFKVGGDGGGAWSSTNRKHRAEDDWLAQQRSDKRRCRWICVSITIVLIIIIVAAAFCGWYFTKGRKL